MQINDISHIEFDSALLMRHDCAAPRYTSYPTADRFVEAFDERRYDHALAARTVGSGNRPVSLYVHLPFCKTVCFYCACNKIETEDRAKADEYLDYLEREIAIQRAKFADAPPINQLHLGGGTPTFLTTSQLDRLINMIKLAFPVAANAECSVEVDPRGLTEGTLGLLAAHGFRRISIGVQDLDPTVQRAVNRIQPGYLTEQAMVEARLLGFRSINLDLIYGLPRQSVETMRTTLDSVIRWRPERIALYSYAHLPDRFKPQRSILDADLPSPASKLAMLQLAIETILAAGYVYIGMDHFALPHDDLAVALRQGRLHRNFQGYSTHADCDLIALGVSAIGKMGASYSQNHRELSDYYDAIDQGHLPLARGLALTADDLLRRAVIQALLCQSELAIEPFETAWLIDFRSYFAPEMAQLAALESDGLVELDTDAIRITARGRLLARVVAMCFDRYLREARTAAQYSRVI